ncbi:MAG: hypothetical protein IJP22_03100 [Clostridia bacterium]|nr:hypothetical protein [Clostridia bacterium]
MGLFSKKQSKHSLDSDNTFFTIDMDETPEEQNEKAIEEKQVQQKEQPQNLAAHVLTAEEINGEQVDNAQTENVPNPLDALRNRMLHKNEPEKIEEPKNEEKSSLFDKCLPYVTDENGKIIEDESSKYSLEKFTEETLSKDELLASIYKKYNISFTGVVDLSGEKEKAPVIEEVKEEPQVDEPISAEELRDVQTNIPFISDIDNESTIDDAEESLSNTGTIRFTPIQDETDHDIISVSSHTKTVNLTGEFTQLPQSTETVTETPIEMSQDEFEEYTPDEEYISPADSKALIIKLARKNRSRFFKMVGTILFSALLFIFKLTAISEILIANFTAFTIITLAIYGVLLLINCDMFGSLFKLFSKKANADTVCSLGSIVCLAYTIMAFVQKVTPFDTVLLASLILCFRSIGAFINASHILSNLRQINSPIKKRAITLINDPSVTFAMAGDSIDGDVLAAAPKYADNISDYMKHVTFGNVMQGKLCTVSISSIIAAIVFGFVIGAYTSNLISGLYSAANILMFAGMPIVYLIENLPLYSAAKKLNRSGAMIAGRTGAALCEKANAIVLRSEDLFPSGTITLHDIKVLSENNIDNTLLRAAALAEEAESPLANIFKKINDQNGNFTLPVADTVKYEDRMGISGWVDDELLFIGNRTLLEAHGIKVPSIETDRRILKNGYFPVYVAGNSCVYALLIVQYSVNPDVAHQLRKLTNLGVTILVNNTDPNLNEEMICDYLGLYSDSVKVMSAAGIHLYKAKIRPEKNVSAPAMYKGNPIALALIINCASKIRKSNTLLTVIYAIASIIGAVLFVYAPFSGSGAILSPIFVLLYNAIATAISYLLYLIFKP